jgi:hypothetical protein
MDFVMNKSLLQNHVREHANHWQRAGHSPPVVLIGAKTSKSPVKDAKRAIVSGRWQAHEGDGRPRPRAAKTCQLVKGSCPLGIARGDESRLRISE